MAIYQQIITSDYNTVSRQAQESWLENCIAFITLKTGLSIVKTYISEASGASSYRVNTAIPGSYMSDFLVTISGSSAARSYFSGISYCGSFYYLDDIGNLFDPTAYYAAKVIVIHTADTLHVLVSFNGSVYKTMLLFEKVTEAVTGNEYWGCRGFVPTSPGAFSLNELVPARGDSSASGAVGDRVSLSNTTTLNGQYTLKNLYCYCLPSVTKLPTFIPFHVAFDDESSGTALITCSVKVRDAGGSAFCSGEYLLFTD